jgi:hypothetical protein
MGLVVLVLLRTDIASAPMFFAQVSASSINRAQSRCDGPTIDDQAENFHPKTHFNNANPMRLDKPDCLVARVHRDQQQIRSPIARIRLVSPRSR